MRWKSISGAGRGETIDLSFLKEPLGLKGDPNTIRDAILLITTKCSVVFPLKIAKLLYLAELEFIKKFGKRPTDNLFISDHYGPNAPEAALIEKIMATKGIVRTEDVRTHRDHIMKRIYPVNSIDDISIPKDYVDCINAVCKTYGRMKTDNLVKASKNTDPYRDTPKKEEINFDDFIREREYLMQPEVSDKIQKSIAEINNGKYRELKSKSEAIAFIDSL